MRRTKSYWRGWLSGFADGEASVAPKEITISNTVLSLLEYYQRGLLIFGIHSRLLGPYTHVNPKYKPVYRLRIWRRDSLLLWVKYIGFQHPSQREKLNWYLK